MNHPTVTAMADFRPLGGFQGHDMIVDDKLSDATRPFDKVIDVHAGVNATGRGHDPVLRTRSGTTRPQNIERQLPKFPHGLFNRRDWDVGRDFGSLTEIGRGKDTVIYRGVCMKPLGVSQEVGRSVALKVYFKNKVSHTKLRAIKREVAMMAFMERRGVPNIVKALTAFADDLHYYIVMEYCEGGDLLDWILKRKKALHERDALSSIIVPLLNSLCQMHSMGIIHRDIKLENIFLGKDLRVLLGDFGLTMSSHQESAISPVGTVEYMAPEVLALPPVEMIVSKAVDPQTVVPNDDKVDIWALGVTLFELVTGKLPFNGKDKKSIKSAIANYELASFPECVSIGCRNIILDMLAYKAEDRPSAFTLKRRITRFLAGESPVVGQMLSTKKVDAHSNEEAQAKMDVRDVDVMGTVGVGMTVAMDCSSSDRKANETKRYGSGLLDSLDSRTDSSDRVARKTSSFSALGGFGRVLRKISSSRKGKRLFEF